MAQITLNLRQPVLLIYGHGYADLGSGHQIHTGLIAVKNFKNRGQKAVGHEHACGGHGHHRNILFVGDGFHYALCAVAFCGFGRDQSAVRLRPLRVKHRDRNVLAHRRQQAGRMQHFGAKIRQLRCFLKGHFADAFGFGNQGGIGGEHAVHIGPDLHRSRIQHSADQSGGIIRSSSSQGCSAAAGVGADKPLHHRHHRTVEQRQQLFARLLPGRFPLRLCFAELRIRDHHLAAVDHDRVHAART
ncbi:MAG: hypothetical protein BWY83_00659 [bacterium ADurb.Bin478]|nr:MAG: hypothetical protein BWY83_00659 [bacterium ADurb.Bin478]